MQSEYIRKQDAIRTIMGQPPDAHYPDWYAAQIEDIHAADVAPVVHGRWVKYTGMGKEQWMCSECSAEEKNPKIARYCYHCGAKMGEMND